MSLEDFWKKHLLGTGASAGAPHLKDTSVRDACGRFKARIELLVDGDIVAYRASAAANGRYYTHPSIVDTKTSNLRRFKYKKDIDKYCEKKKLDLSKIESKVDPEPLAYATYNCEKTLKTILDKSTYGYVPEDIRMRIYLTGDLNFRDDISPEYKAHRVADKPHHLAACKDFLMSEYGATVVEGLEADDLMGIRQMECMGGDVQTIICTTDKDLMGIPGYHYNWVTDSHTKTTEETSLAFFYTQVLTGDKTDNIKGCKGIGPVKAKQIIDEAFRTMPTSGGERRHLYVSTLNAYYEVEKKDNPKETKLNNMKVAAEKLKMNAQLLWILREPFVMWEEPKCIGAEEGEEKLE